MREHGRGYPFQRALRHRVAVAQRRHRKGGAGEDGGELLVVLLQPEQAGQPVEARVGGRLDAQFLRGLLGRDPAAGRLEHVQRGQVLVIGVDVERLLVRGDRGQPQAAAQAQVQRDRTAILLDLLERIGLERGGVRPRGEVGLRGRRHGLAVHRLAFVARALQRHVDRQRSRRLHAHQRTGVVALAGARSQLGAREVVDPAVGLVAAQQQRCLHRAAQRRADPHAEVALAVAADVDVAAGLETIGRLAGGDVERTGNRVLAEQRALRAAQHLDALDAEKALRVGFGAAGVDAVDVHAHARVVARVAREVADAAQAHAAAQRAIGGAAGQAGRQLRQVEQVLDAASFEVSRGHGLHRHRHHLEVLRALLRGDLDGLQLRALGQGGACHGRGSGKGDQAQGGRR